MLYEGAGADKLRYLVECGGPLSPDDPVCNVIWAVKALRNKLLRHDPDHGSEPGIAKSWEQFSECLGDIGIRRWPVTESDFTHLQDVLIERTAAFLQTLLVTSDVGKRAD